MKSEVKQQIEAVLNAPSCYPNENRKPRVVRENELLEWYEKYQEVNTCYNLYGMDRLSCEPIENWLDRGVFRKQRHDVNCAYYPYGSKFSYDYTLLMRDKEAFEMLMHSIWGNEKKYMRSYGVFKNSIIYKKKDDGRITAISRDELLEDFEGKKVVWKNSFGFGGSDIMVCNIFHRQVIHKTVTYEINEFLQRIDKSNSIWLIQEYVEQHSALSLFNNSSVNTMRFLTYNTGDRIVFGNAVLRYGREGSNVDNCDMGGFFSGINDDGSVGESMFCYTEKMRFVCPNKGKIIPYFKEAKELVMETHNHVPQLFSVGWDIVITKSGPVILEGNDGWDPYLSQTPLGNAQRSLWDDLLLERLQKIGRKQ